MKRLIIKAIKKEAFGKAPFFKQTYVYSTKVDKTEIKYCNTFSPHNRIKQKQRSTLYALTVRSGVFNFAFS